MHPSSPLLPTVILLSAGVVGLAVARFARISPIVGFIAIGALIGPQAFGLVDSRSPTLQFLGELGVCFLLFDIGLHLSVKELRKDWKAFFFSGLLQCIAVTTLLTFSMYWLGLTWAAAFVIAAILSLSSTALVLKILSDEREDSSPVGKRATGVLVFQDIIAILLLVVLTGDLSKGVSPMTLLLPIGKMVLAAIAVVLISRVALKPLFRLLIALKSDEVFTAFALLLVFVASWGTEALGLSLALGAFLGGLALSESSYAALVRGEVAPFRSLLLSLFFLSVGINLDLISMYDNLAILLMALAAFTALKIAGNWIAFRMSGIARAEATLLSFLLAQGSEFCFVLLGVALSAGLIDASTESLCVSLVGLSLAITPFLAGLGCWSSRSVCHIQQESDPGIDDPREVIIVRVDDFGRQLAALLDAERIPYRGHDNDLERLAYAKTRGLNVYYADLNRPRTLGRASLGKASAIVSLLEDDSIIRPLVEGLRRIDSSIPFIASSESQARLQIFSALGVENIFLKNEASIIVVFEALLRALGFVDAQLDAALNRALQTLEPERLFPRSSPIETLAPQSLAA
jgi:Kef-type K+ transport system membrane component KefB